MGTVFALAGFAHIGVLRIFAVSAVERTSCIAGFASRVTNCAVSGISFVPA